MDDFQVPVYSSSEVIEKLQTKWQSAGIGGMRKKSYAAMYSSFFGGITVDPAMMTIPIDDHMVHRGHGVFDTATIFDGNLYDLDSHLDRLLNSARLAKITPPFPRQALKTILIKLASVSRCREGSLRYWLSAGPGNFSLSSAGCSESTFYAIAMEEYHEPRRPEVIQGVKVITSTVPMKSCIFATIKNVNYLPNALSLLEAEENGAFASIWIDDQGCIAEGPNANIAFINKTNHLLLPSFKKTLGGCTANRLTHLASELVRTGVLEGVTTKDITVEEGKECNEMMFVGSGLPIIPIIAWDDQPIGDGRVGDRTLILYDLLWDDMKNGPGRQRIPVPFD